MSISSHPTATPISMWDPWASSHPKHVAFIAGHEMWTYERLSAEVEHLAWRFLREACDPGDSVALHIANLPELVESATRGDPRWM